MGVGLFGEFLKSPNTIGAVAASGSTLCKLMVELAGVSEAGRILELGTGTGATTAEILRQKTESSRLVGIELNPNLADVTKKRCPEVEVIVDNALRAKAILNERGIEDVDCVVSGLPWASFSFTLQESLLDSIDSVLALKGRFVTFAYVHGLLLPSARQFYVKLSERFAEVTKSSIVWNNLPPAVVYLAER